MTMCCGIQLPPLNATGGNARCQAALPTLCEASMPALASTGFKATSPRSAPKKPPNASATVCVATPWTRKDDCSPIDQQRMQQQQLSEGRFAAERCDEAIARMDERMEDAAKPGLAVRVLAAVPGVRWLHAGPAMK